MGSDIVDKWIVGVVRDWLSAVCIRVFVRH